MVLCGLIASGTPLIITRSTHLWLLRDRCNSSYVASGTDREKAHWTCDFLVSIIGKQKRSSLLRRRESAGSPKRLYLSTELHYIISEARIFYQKKKLSFQGTFFGNIWSSWRSWIFIFYGLEGSTPICTIL